MAGNSTNRKPSGNRNSGNRSSGNRGKSSNSKKTAARKRSDEELIIINYAVIIGALFLCVLLFLANFGKVGKLGEYISMFMFAVFGWNAYIFPVLLIVIAFLWISNQSEGKYNSKLISFVIMFFCLGVIIEVLKGYSSVSDTFDFNSILRTGYEDKTGGGLISGSIGFLMKKLIDTPFTVALNLVIMLICVMLVFGKAIVTLVTEGRQSIEDTAREAGEFRREQIKKKKAMLAEELNSRDERLAQKQAMVEKRRNKEMMRNEAKEEELRKIQVGEDESILRMDKKVKGVSFDTDLKESSNRPKHDDMHEIILKDEKKDVSHEVIKVKDSSPYDREIRIHTPNYDDESSNDSSEVVEEIKEPTSVNTVREPVKPIADLNAPVQKETAVVKESHIDKAYKFPPLTLLSKPEKRNSSSKDTLEQTAKELEDALESFGIAVTVTEVTQGPSVTRFELKPPPGIKLSRIKALQDDLKLYLAAKDIRIEAPIPGKAAVGIEVPNAESSGVKLRELLEDASYKNFNGNIAFAVGKDIAGKVIVSDISKMPHMLIAGSTGSGKSVCINTIIMSIIYKHDPKDVQMIMVDPKVVELNVYNGIPHLMIPVVTDPKKAAGALHWAVEEMTNRYKLFADLGVRDLKGYNTAVENDKANMEASGYKHLPQIVIIVDELADLMMVAAKEVEESICRLAQLARACGIHLIVATQRPSVDVITGLIKANMPSRVAFAVSSGTDSRTILDMNGAERLLGKGDMLFFPQGYTQPDRLQGAFVSDSEVTAVVEFIKNQRLHNEFGEAAAESVEKISASSSSSASSGGDESQVDELFIMAGRFIIEAQKASIGNLQRKFRIGFNRAARIMDQLCEMGVVSEENGTKPREILMDMDEFEQLTEEYNV